VRFSVAVAVLLFACANRAAADLYRWVDPETGSVKFSSYPPPWFGDPARERRAPKVEQIPAGKPSAAGEAAPPEAKPPPRTAPEAVVKLQAPASSAQEDRRKLLLKQIAVHAANLATAKPEETARIYAELADRVREYRSTEQFLSQVDAVGEGARRSEWSEMVAAAEARRRKALEQLSAVRAPAEGSAPESVRGAWEDLERQRASFATVNNALKLLDPAGAQARDAEQALLTEKIILQWKPALDAIGPRPAQ